MEDKDVMTPEEIKESIKKRVKGVITMDQKEIDVNGKRVIFHLTRAEIGRSESALSFNTILSLAELIKMEAK